MELDELLNHLTVERDDPIYRASKALNGPENILISRQSMTIIVPHCLEALDAPEEPKRRLFTVAVDLDGTLAENQDTHDPDAIGELRRGAKKMLQALQDAGARICINTVRGDRELVADWMDKHDLPYDYINENPDQPAGSSDKMIADVYLDDRAVPADDLDAAAEEILRRLAEHEDDND